MSLPDARQLNEMVELGARALALRALERSAARGEGEGQAAWTLRNERERHIEATWPEFADDALAVIEAAFRP